MSDVQLGVTKDGGSCELVDILLIDSLAIVYSSSLADYTKVRADPFEGSNFLGPEEHIRSVGICTYCRYINPIMIRGDR